MDLSGSPTTLVLAQTHGFGEYMSNLLATIGLGSAVVAVEGCEEVIQERKPRMVVIEERSKRGEGEFCAGLRKRFPQLAIVVLTKKVTPQLTSQTLEGGADRYLEISAPKELLGGVIGALWRRVEGSWPPVVKAAAKGIFTPVEKQILDYLVGNSDRVISYLELGRVVGKVGVKKPSTIRGYVTHLRARLGAQASALVSVPRVGYRWSR